MSDFHVIIAGAGITGLILAQALKKQGIRYSIFERDSSLNVRSNEWTMAIHWSLERLEKLLPPEVYADMERASCNPAVPIEAGGNYPIIHGETGEIIAGVPYAKGLRVPRSKMRALCGEGIDVQYGKRLAEVHTGEDNKVTVTFEDGSTTSGDLLVGVDGTRSRVREVVMGSPEAAATHPFPIWHMNMTVCYGDAEKARYLRQDFPTSFLALSQRSFHAFQSISSMPDGPDHPETWKFHLAMAWNEKANHDLSDAERLALIKEKASTLGEPARSSFTWIPDGTPISRADISYWVPKHWDNKSGRVTLAGDAAHPMPPYRGQGLNHCITDISKLVEEIQQVVKGDKALAAAVTDYENEMIPRGAEEVECSVENGRMLHDWEKVKASPVFNRGFRPMQGNDTWETNENADDGLKKAQAARGQLNDTKTPVRTEQAAR